jgi:hypothetical protein
LFRVAIAHQAQQRRAAGQQACRRQHLLAPTPQLVACAHAGELHAGERLLLRLLAQQADAAEGEGHDRDQQQSADGQRQRRCERSFAGQPAPRSIRPGLQAG